MLDHSVTGLGYPAIYRKKVTVRSMVGGGADVGGFEATTAQLGES